MAESSRELRGVVRAAVALRDVGKTYGGVAALCDVTLDFEAGAIHALVGQNGAGNSTCLGVIAGRVSATQGTIDVGGHEYSSAMQPSDARALGVSAIYQELTVVQAMSAMDNVMLTAAQSTLGFLDRRSMRRRYDERNEWLDVTIPPDVRAGDLSVADQQMVEIMRALSMECSVLLMDEPTASLTPAERESLFRVVHQLRDAGVTIFLVSHHLDEVLKHADTVTVFRDGRTVERRRAAQWTKDQLVVSMLGNELETLRRASAETSQDSPTPMDESATVSAPVLRVQGLTSHRGVRDVNLVVHPGEIVGLGGLVGSGRSSLIRAIAGNAAGVEGLMWVDGSPTAVPRCPRQATRLGMRVLPEDRKLAGIIPAMVGAENMLLGEFERFACRWSEPGADHQHRSGARLSSAMPQ